jgi:hypothetical protein
MEQALASRVHGKRACAVLRRAGGKGPGHRYLACCLSYHFRGAIQIRSELVRINCLPDVEHIIRTALDNPQTFDDEGSEVLQEADRDPELDLTCAC